MGVLVSDPPAELSGSAVMGILQIRRNRQAACLPYQFLCGKNRVDRGVALGCTGHIGGRLRQDDLCLREAYPLTGQRTGDRDRDRLRIRISHILRCADHDPARNKLGVLSCFQHARQIVDGRVGIRSPHTLDKGGDRVVVIVTALVIAGRPPLDAFLGDFQSDPHLPVRRGLCRQNAEFHCAECPPGVPFGDIRQKIRRIIVDRGIVHAHSLLRIIDGAHDQGPNIRLRERFELKDR